MSMTTQTPDAVREARKIVALNSSLPPDAVNAGLFDDAPIMRCTLAALDSRAGNAGEGLQSAVADTLNAAWALCDDTENGDSDRPSVPRDAWKRLADALDALEAIIPKNEQPCWPGAAARLLATRDPAVSGLQPVAGHTEGCGVHDDYDCDCPATPAPAVDAVPAGEAEAFGGVPIAAIKAQMQAVEDEATRTLWIGAPILKGLTGYIRAALSHGEGRK